MSAKFWVLILAGFFLTACGGPADEAAPADESSASEAMEDEEEGVFDPMVGTIDRAEDVQDAGVDRKDEMDEAIEGSE